MFNYYHNGNYNSSIKVIAIPTIKVGINSAVLIIPTSDVTTISTVIIMTTSIVTVTTL
jgi:hypothetical protein